MRKQLMLLFCCMIIVSVSGCGGQYSDAVDVQEDFIDLCGDYVADMDAADSAEKVAAAMNNYADGLEDLAPRFREINEKYPELRNPEKQPEQFKKIASEQEEMMQDVSNSFMKAMPYMNDPDVRRAQERIVQAMQSMN